MSNINCCPMIVSGWILAGYEGRLMTGFEISHGGRDGHEERIDLASVDDSLFDATKPVRVAPSYPEQRYFPGLYYAVTCQRLLYFESWLERRHLMLFDRDPTVVAMSTQPFWLHWRVAGKDRRHVPDVFVRDERGCATVVDVRPRQFVESSRESFNSTAEACALVGWNYRIVHEPAPVMMANVEWIAGYRRPVPVFAEVRGLLLDAASDGDRLSVVVSRAGGSPVLRATAFHLLWTGELAADLRSSPLGDHTFVVAA